MIQAYVRSAEGLQQAALAADGTRPDGLVWVDLLQPTAQEEHAVEAALGIDVPTAEEMAEIETSSRLYRQGAAVFMSANIISRGGTDQPQSAVVTFILTDGCLVTLRHADPRPFAAFLAQASRDPQACRTGEEAFAGLLEAIVDRLADLLEAVGEDMDTVSGRIFAPGPQAAAGAEFKDLLGRIGRNGDLASKARESLVSLERLVTFAGQALHGDAQQAIAARLGSVSRDMQSLSDYANFISGKVNFALDATLGMINIEQNNIIKIFSVAAVVLLPPTLVASIYGMNFRHMPELEWLAGYPYAIAVMIISAVLPYLYVKRRGWL